MSKGSILLNLKPKLRKSEIPRLKIFTLKNWRLNKANILKEIKKYFKNDTLVIRSDKSDEDSSRFSQAGMYHSELNVKCKNKNLIMPTLKKITDISIRILNDFSRINKRKILIN
jgi:hypothetical protein